MNLNTTIDLDLIGFFRWWGRELAFVLPARVKSWLREDRGCFVLRPVDTGFDVTFVMQQQLSAPQPASIGDAESFRQFRHQCSKADKAEIVLRLPADKILSRTIHLPLAAVENLQQVVAFELDRYTPFAVDQVYFAAVMQGKTEFDQIQVRLILTPKRYLDDQLALLQSWSVRADRVECDSSSDEAIADSEYDLLPAHYRQSRSWWQRSAHGMLWLFIGLLVVAVLCVPVWMESQAVDMIKQQIKSLDKQTRDVEAQQQEIDALRNETQKLIDIKQQTPSLVLVLNELSSLLNDDTWLTHFQYSEKHLQIQGQSPSASALISVLEESDFFSNVSFVSPLTQDKATGRERFQIGMDVSAVVPSETPDAEDTSEADDSQASEEEVTPEADGENTESDAVTTIEAEETPSE